MSAPDMPANTPVEASPAVDADLPPPPRRLPDELILMVVDWCDKLLRDRLKTLAALVLPGKRYKDDVERRLYSRVVLEDGQRADYTSAGATRDALIRRPSLRHFVRAVELVYVHPRDGYATADVKQVLGDLPAVEELKCKSHTDSAADYIVSNPLVQIRRFESCDQGWVVDDVLDYHTAAFASLEILVLDTSGLPEGRHDILCGVKNFTVTELYEEDEHDLARFTSPFAATLTRLSLPITSALATCEPTVYSSLQHLRLSDDYIQLDTLRRATSGVVVFLAAATRLASLVSFEWHCMIAPWSASVRSDMLVATSAAPTPIAQAFLAVVPPQIRHLSLLTDCFAPADIAAYLLDDAQRPSQLATLRIGDELGRGLGRILGGEVVDEVEGAEGPCGALAGVLERAGVEVTTVE
ncbi:hypothetical protein JCM9279_003986 [Rhodotorula babjevae]